MEAHPAVPSKEDRAAHSLVGEKINPDGKGSGWSTIVVELHCHSRLSASAEHLVTWVWWLGRWMRRQRRWRPFVERLLGGCTIEATLYQEGRGS